jgi:tetratricopeptide (TPR) repeat protein/tRNA A-37 threonylcarbamoyl transferase component Bud32
MTLSDSGCIAADDLSLLFEGHLSAAQQARIDGHIDGCPRCFDLVADLARGLPPAMDDAPAPLAPEPAQSSSSTSGVLPRGATIQGRYQILELAGVGGMGVIYIAHDHALDRRVALKVLRHDRRADRLSGNAQVRFIREAQTLARLSHPNVVVVYDILQGEGDIFIAMELIAGRTLRLWLEGPPRPPLDQILTMFISAGRGLAAAHAAGVIHRDFKPDNVLVGLDGRVRVTDFGLARSPTPLTADTASIRASPASAAEERTSDSDGVIAGTPRYMAPEQRQGTGTDARSDQFSFAVALYEALHGEHPFPSATGAAQLAALERSGLHPPPHGQVPRRFHRIILRALRVDPARRFASMDELCDALERARHRRTRVAWGLAAATAVAWGLGAVLLSRAGDAPLCEPAATELAGVWDEPTRQAVRDAMAAAPSPALGGTWTTIEGELDAVASAWSERHDAACTTAKTSDGPARREASAILECLQQSREQLRVLTEMSARADPSALSFIARGRLSEGLKVACTSPEVARLTAPLPTAPLLRAQVVELRIRIDEAFGVESEGRLAEARALANVAVAQAEASGFEPVISEALLRRGTIEHQMGDLEAAASTLEHALAVAEVAHHDKVIPEIWMALAVVDTSRGRLAEASRGLDRATAFFARLNLPPETTARLHSKRAMILRALGKHRAALDAEDQALTLYRAGPNAAVFEAGALTVQATSYAAIGAWDRALELDRRALAVRERQLGPEHTRVAGSLNNIGVALMATGAHEEAQNYFRRALTIREKLQGPDGLDVSHVLLSLAELERLTGRPAIARMHLEHVLAIRERVLGRNHLLVAEALHRLGALLTGQGEIGPALAMLTRARSITERSLGSTHPTTALIVATLAHAELAGDDPAAARPLLEAAVEILDPADVRPDERAAANFDLARALIADPLEGARALQFAAKARSIYRAIGPPAARSLAEVETWLAAPPAPAP